MFPNVQAIIFLLFSINILKSDAKDFDEDDGFQPVAVEYLQLKNQTDFENLKYTHYEDLKGVSIENTNLTHIPVELFRKFHLLREIKLKNNNITNLRRETHQINDVALMKNITMLHIEKQHIPILKNNTFVYFKRLENLTLICSGIETVEEDAFKGLDTLEFLDFSGNKVAKFSSKVLAPLVRLKTLILNSNQFKSAFDIFGNTRLKELSRFYLNNNPMKGLNEEKLGTLFPKLRFVEYCSTLNQLCPKFNDTCLMFEVDSMSKTP